METTNSGEGTWPEQNAVDSWLKKHGIKVTNKQAFELKEMVTKQRIILQKELERVKFEMLPWWKKDRLGWPITTFKGKPIQSSLRIFCQNIRKLLP